MRSSVAIALSLGGVHAASAQSREATAASSPDAPAWVHESWTVKDGLPVNSINWLLQDRTGYIWAATYDGLVRFDGVRFTTFNAANSPGLPSNRLLRLTEGGDGDLWLQSEQNHLIRFHAGTFTDIRPPATSGGGTFDLVVVDSGGTAWLGGTHGLWRYRAGGLEQVAAGTITGRVSAVVAQRDGSMLAAVAGAGVYRIHDAALDIPRIDRLHLPAAVDTAVTLKMFEDGAGVIWLAGTAGLWSGRTDYDQVALPVPALFPFHIVETTAPRALYLQAAEGLFRVVGRGGSRLGPPENYIYGPRLWTDGGAVWHATGAEVLREGTPVFSLETNGDPLSRTAHTISAVLLDREGSLWLGTQAAGLHRLKAARFTTFGTAEGVGRNIYPLVIDREGLLWLSAWGTTVRRFDPATGRVTAFTSPGADLSTLYSIAQDSAGAMWFGSPSAIYACDVARAACRLQHLAPGGDVSSRAIHVDRSGRVWVGGTGAVYRKGEDRWQVFRGEAGVPPGVVRAFAETGDGAIWIGTNGGGVARFADDRFRPIGTADGLPSVLVRALHQDADGWLWIATEDRGLARLSPAAWAKPESEATPAERRIVRISSADGLFDDVIHTILEDNFGRLWMSTNRGIFWVSRAELNAFADGTVSRIHSVGYTERDGMRNREANGGVYPAGATGRDGRLWFPTQDGVVVVDPSRIQAEPGPPPLVVERLASGGQRLPLDHDSAMVQPSQRDFEVDYTALTFLEPANVRFRYRLEGYDAGWVDAGNRRTAFYTKVPPGRYAFRLQATGTGGDWYEPGIAVDVHVIPQFWETTLFRLGALLALLVAVRAALRWRLRALQDRAKALESTVEERTAALREREQELSTQNTQLAEVSAQLQVLDAAKSRFFANVSHELRTPLTLTIGPLDDLRQRGGQDAQAERWLDIALRNSRRLLRLVNQILDVAKLEAGEMTLAPRPLDVASFVRGIVDAFAGVAERKGILLAVEGPASLPGVLDPDALEKVVSNLLSNALKFTPDGGRVTLSLTPGGSRVVLAVRDTGPGIPPEHLSRVFERFHQVDESSGRSQPGTGIGLSLVKELVELQSGTVTVESGRTGTVFTVALPLGTGSVLPPPRAGAILAEGVHPEDETEKDDRDPPSPDVPTLLVVDDSADLRRYIGDHFAGRFRVVEAGDGAEGAAVAARELPDVIVCDLMMPGTDGHELLRRVRASPETDFLPIIMLTAAGSTEQRVAGLGHGADDYMVKPFAMRELEARVDGLIAMRRRLRERFAGPGGPGPQATLPSLPPGLAEHDQRFVIRVREAIRDHLADASFGVAELAHAVATDRSHLFRRSRQLLEATPSDLLRQARLAEGARLLTGTSGTVSDVAYAVGFNSVSYFCRCFQEVYGVTPAIYRSRAPAR